MVSEGEVDNCLKKTRHQPDDHYGWAGQAFFPYSLGLGLHAGRHLVGCLAYWSPSGSVSIRSPIISGTHVLVIWPSVWPSPPASPPSLGASGETNLRWVGLLGCWTWQ